MPVNFFTFWAQAFWSALQLAWHWVKVSHYSIVLLFSASVAFGFGFNEHSFIWVPIAVLLVLTLVGTLYQAYQMYSTVGGVELAALKSICHGYEQQIDQIILSYEKNTNRYPVVLDEEVVVTIDGQGNNHILDRRKIKATAGQLQNYLIDKFGGPAEEAPNFHCLDFTLLVHSAHQIAFLPCRRTSDFQVLLIFLPALAETTDPQELEFTISWRWPNASKTLLDKAICSDYFTTLVNSSANVPSVRIKFRIHNSIPPLKLQEKGHHPGKVLVPSAANLAEPDYRVYLWESKDVPPGKTVGVTLNKA
jgi:hypothetical protein